MHMARVEWICYIQCILFLITLPAMSEGQKSSSQPNNLLHSTARSETARSELSGLAFVRTGAFASVDPAHRKNEQQPKTVLYRVGHAGHQRRAPFPIAGETALQAAPDKQLGQFAAPSRLGFQTKFRSRLSPQQWLSDVLEGKVDEQEAQELDVLRSEYDRDGISTWGARRPMEVSNRLFLCGQAFIRIKNVWEKEKSLPADKRTRGQLLRNELAKLGPVAVKVGQTLSQRPDLLDEDVCEELKGLQTTNLPFPNTLAWQVIADELGWKGQIAPGLPLPPGSSVGEATLFAALSPEPIASASLGQVYRGTTHEGIEIALKVQRPAALKQCLLDGVVLIGVLGQVQGLWGNGDLLEIVDVVASGILQELDFRNEARNAVLFGESLAHLGYVTVPKTIHKYSVGPRVMASEWVYGRHLKDLTKEEGLKMCAMSVEAVTAGLVLTGLVHADPHEGNMMLDDDGRLVFLDFGLMSSVEPEIMEAFATGIQAVLNKDWPALTEAFVATGFFGVPLMYRKDPQSPWVPGDKEEVTKELAMRMEAEEGGLSRFGALSTVLFEMSDRWEEFTPPYILLLIRTFLTLEGVAGQVDPTFNIYEAALPWAIQRALSPSTQGGAETLRSTLLTKDNQLQWQRFEQIILDASSGDAEVTSKDVATTDTSGVTGSVTPFASFRTVMGSPEGAPLRRIARDLDSPELLLKLAAPSSRTLRHLAVNAIATAISKQESEVTLAAAEWPLSEFGAAFRQRRLLRLSSVLNVLLRSHAQRLVNGGWRGLAAMGALLWLTFRIGIAGLAKGVLANTRNLTGRVFGAKRV